MIELTATKKNKVNLSDYDYKRDVQNRLLLSQFTTIDYAVLEDILFSSIRTTLRKISKNIDVPEDQVATVLQKLKITGLFAFEDDQIVVDKEMRKYFETELGKFDEAFEPDMEFLGSLLKKVPIHILPQWYAIPRTSDNIFGSIIEKYLLTPQIFQRHLLELNLPEPTLAAIAQDVLKAPHFEITAHEIQKKYNLSPEKFHEAMLNLEFHFVCTLTYRKQDDHWYEIVTLFHEWKDYLLFLKETHPITVTDVKKIDRYRPADFAFVEDMTAVLLHAQKEPAFLDQKKGPTLLSSFDGNYLKRLLLKIEEIDLASLEGKKLILTEAGLEWLGLKPENRAVYLYRHPSSSQNEKVIREVEKSILRILHSGWVRLSDFLRGVAVPVSDGQAVSLRKVGKNWKYARPSYSPDELRLIQTVVLDHLFEAGVTAVGEFDGEPCLLVTPFGQSLFG